MDEVAGYYLLPNGYWIRTADSTGPYVRTGLSTFSLVSSGGVVPPAYVGPWDVQTTNILFGISTRALSAALAGSNVATIKKHGTGSTLALVTSSTTGACDPSAVTTFLGGSVGDLMAWPDQGSSGIIFADQANVKQIHWTDGSGLGGVPGFGKNGDEGACILVSPTGTIPVAPGVGYTIFAVNYLSLNINSSPETLMSATDTVVGSYLGLNFGDPTEQGMHIQTGDGTLGGFWTPNSQIPNGLHVHEIVIAANGSVTLLRDGVSVPITNSGDTLTVAPGFLGATLDLEGCCAPSNAFSEVGANSYNCELLVFQTPLNSTQRSAIRANVGAFYGIAVS